MNSTVLDRPRDVRRGEELPTEKLAAYLQTHLPEASGTLSVRQFPSGHSNLTYALNVGERDLVLRRPPFGANNKTAHDMAREYRILSHLHPVYGRVPRPLLYCEDESVIGAPFYIMERVQGIILRAKPPAGLNLTLDVMQTLSTATADNLVAIHAIDYRAAGLGDLGKPQGYVARQVHGWTERYVNAKTDDIPDTERVAAWLADAKRLPPESGAALIHNDYKYDNLVLDPNDLSLRAVLDWEMATIGDPLMDLGTMLGYWVEADDPEELRAIAFGLTTLPGNLTREEIIEYYAVLTGRDVSRIQFYYVYALFKIAVIVQQIYNRYKNGFTEDPRFAEMIDVVRVLSKTAAREIEKS
ncbi:MAG: phosphotransferase family protein [Chloroflexota bacterium]|nr:phosphotransferase family protein [Chloroflexota bacterium]